MIIAVTYDQGQIFPHFGQTRTFKLYDVQKGKILSSTILESGQLSHGQLVGLLAQNNVDVLICGGMGQHAFARLKDAAITVINGISGKADEAISAYLNGSLRAAGPSALHQCHH